LQNKKNQTCKIIAKTKHKLFGHVPPVAQTPNRGGTKGLPESFYFFFYIFNHHKSLGEFKFCQVNLSRRKSRKQEWGEIIRDKKIIYATSLTAIIQNTDRYFQHQGKKIV